MYGKLFDSTFTGSMFGAGPDVFAVWAYVIANTVDSSVELNPSVLAAAIGSTPEAMRSAISYLCSADPDSRNPAEEGRRLIKDGAFQYRVVSHEHYRGIRDQEALREYNREKKREYRAKAKEAKMSLTVLDCPRLSTEAEAEAEAELKISPETAFQDDQQQPGSLFEESEFATNGSGDPLAPATTSNSQKPSARGKRAKARSELDAAVEECFAYFREKFHKSSTYKLDAKCRAMGIEGLKACAELATEHGREDPSRMAVKYLKEAIDRMAVDPFHNGANENQTKYLDWEQLFGSKKKPVPRKLLEFWLDDDRFARP